MTFAAVRQIPNLVIARKISISQVEQRLRGICFVASKDVKLQSKRSYEAAAWLLFMHHYEKDRQRKFPKFSPRQMLM